MPSSPLRSSTCLPVNEALPQRPAPAAQVAHALPGQEGRPGEEALQVPLRQPKLRPHALPHRLLACMPSAQPGAVLRLPVVTVVHMSRFPSSTSRDKKNPQEG